jgi:hypothetical protein
MPVKASWKKILTRRKPLNFAATSPSLKKNPVESARAVTVKIRIDPRFNFV